MNNHNNERMNQDNNMNKQPKVWKEIEPLPATPNNMQSWNKWYFIWVAVAIILGIFILDSFLIEAGLGAVDIIIIVPVYFVLKYIYQVGVLNGKKQLEQEHEQEHTVKEREAELAEWKEFQEAKRRERNSESQAFQAQESHEQEPVKNFDPYTGEKLH